MTTLAGEATGQVLWRRLRSPAAWSETVDLFAILTAASLPWSTSLAGIFNALMLLWMVPFLDVREFLHSLKRPICLAPIALVLLALVGTLWSDAALGGALLRGQSDRQAAGAAGPALSFCALAPRILGVRRFLVSCALCR